jgi:Cys-rich four helix bundle protein (predicted Tat secretion target)
MNRRNAIITTGSMLVSASLGALACGGNNAVAQNTPPKTPGTPAAPAGHHHGGNAEVAEAAHACIAKGEACMAHCLGMFAMGDTSMSGCAKTVHEMHAMMQGLAAAANSGSKHLAALAKVAAEFCKDCEVECKKHADKHAVCKDCMDACTKTIAACAKVA